MATKRQLKTTFEPGRVIQPIFTGGSISIDNEARILATTLGEDVILTDAASGRSLATVEGDGETLSSMSLTPSGSHLIVCSRSLSMKIYPLNRTEDGKEIQISRPRSLKPHTTPIVVLATDPTSTLVAAGASDGTLKVWDISGGYITHTFRGPSALTSSLHFFEVPKGATDKWKGKKAAETVAEHDDKANTVNWRLAAGFQDGQVRVWDLHRRNCIATLESHNADVTAIDFSPSQLSLVTASRDQTVVWWDVKSWKMRTMVPCLERVEGAGFVDNGRIVFSAGEKGFLRLWETETGRELTQSQTARGETEAVVGALYRPELPFIILIQMDHTLSLYRLPSRGNKAELEAPQPFRRVSGTHDEIFDMAYLTLDKNLLALATNSEDIRIVSVAEEDDSTTAVSSQGEKATYFGQDIGLLKGHDDTIVTMDTDWSGHWIVTGSKDNTARLWKIDARNDIFECYMVITGHTETVGAVGLPHAAPAESTEAFLDPISNPPPFIITGSQDLTVKKWKVPRQSQLDPRSHGPQVGPRAEFNRRAHDKDVNAVDVHPDGRLFASASQDKTVKIWSAEDGEVLGLLRGHRRGVWTVKFAPPGLPMLQGEDNTVSGRGVVLTGSGDKTLKLWNLVDYSCIRTFEGHANSVLKVVWLYKDRGTDDETNDIQRQQQQQQPVLAASAGGDGLVKVWDLNSGEVECTLDNHTDRVWALAVDSSCRDGTTATKTTMTLASGGGDSTVTFWRDTTELTRSADADAAATLVRREQELENRVRTGRYRDAIVLALELDHPGRLLALFTQVVRRPNPEPGSLTGLHAVDEVLAAGSGGGSGPRNGENGNGNGLSDDQLFKLLLRLRDWNANARTAPVAQRVLWAVLRSCPPDRIPNLKVRNFRRAGADAGDGDGTGPGSAQRQQQQSLREVLRALKAYTERHYRRVEELIDDSYLVEYTLQKMDGIVAPIEQDKDGDTVMV